MTVPAAVLLLVTAYTLVTDFDVMKKFSSLATSTQGQTKVAKKLLRTLPPGDASSNSGDETRIVENVPSVPATTKTNADETNALPPPHQFDSTTENSATEVHPHPGSTEAIVVVFDRSTTKDAVVGRHPRATIADLQLDTPMEPDWGGLELQWTSPENDQGSSSSSNVPRVIADTDEAKYETEMSLHYETYASDEVEEYFWGYHDHYNPTLQSVKAAAVTHMKPNCHWFHELEFIVSTTTHNNINNNMNEEKLGRWEYLASGYYRDTFQYTTTTKSFDQEDNGLVLKRQKYSQFVNRFRLEKVRNEALIMELLTSSPRITRAYGHCAFSLAVEPAVDSISNSIIPYYKDFQNYPGVLPQQNLDYEPELRYFNNHTAVEKLAMALVIAESLAEIHGLPTGPLMLGDVALDQWLITRDDGRIVLNDFDNSVFLGWRMEEQRYSPFYSTHVGGYKAPEEVVGDFLDERTDMWKVGDLIYGLLTGLQPYYDDLHQEQPDLLDIKIRAGIPPFIDPRFKDQSYIEGRLVDIMMQCFQKDPADRVDIFTVVAWLRETQQIHNKT